MDEYFNESESMYQLQRDDCEAVIQTVANKYMADNPPVPLTFRLSCENGIKRNEDCRYVFDLSRIFPNAQKEQISFAWGKLLSNVEKVETFSAVAYGPMRIFLNGDLVTKSDYYTEKFSSEVTEIPLKLKKGWNFFVLSFIKTSLGFGSEFGAASYKYHPIKFLAPSLEREGQEGFIYTQSEEMGDSLPSFGESEKETGLQWLPSLSWSDRQQHMGQMQRLYGIKSGCQAYGWTRLKNFGKGSVECRIQGVALSPIIVLIDGAEVFTSGEKTAFDQCVSIKAGIRDVLVISECGPDAWGYTLKFLSSEHELSLQNPSAVHGTDDPWLYIGPFAAGHALVYPEITTLCHTFNTVDGCDYWRADLPGMRVRPFLEASLFGKWDYPAGVTLYGLLRIAVMQKNKTIIDYVKTHIEICTAFYSYCLWDKEEYGFVGLNNQLSAIDSLDDCGSFAATMLEAAKQTTVQDYRLVADDVANYIFHCQARLEDGAFYRPVTKQKKMDNTMWVDDLYMSASFLIRYYELTKDLRYIEDAAKQFILYRKHLEIPQKNIMSHVYYTDKKIANEIPWGRGNGWVLFSLLELLEVLPKDHTMRPELISMFQTLCEGYRVLQDANGMWHQILTDPQSYAETSCTAIFVYAFAKGIQSGWLTDIDSAISVAQKGWHGLTAHAIDQWGNIYGICHGSDHSFTYRYYKYELGYVQNDTHGIGPVLLAGIEILKLRAWMENA